MKPKIIKSYKQAIDSMINTAKIIKDKQVREFTIQVINELPERFFVLPASSTNKYHPQISNMKHGLVMHTLSLIKYLMLRLEDPLYKNKFTDLQIDMMISAGLLHDGAKYHLEKYTTYAMYKHPLMMQQYLLNNMSNYDIPAIVLIEIADIILTHQGYYNKISHNSEKTFGRYPMSALEIAVSEADFMVSRKDLAIDFSEFVVGD